MICFDVMVKRSIFGFVLVALAGEFVVILSHVVFTCCKLMLIVVFYDMKLACSTRHLCLDDTYSLKRMHDPTLLL